MFKTFVMAAALCAAIAFPAAAHAAPEIGQPAPAFTGTDSNGNTHSLEDYKGKIVVLEWINHECPYVKKYYDTNTMQSLQKAATADGVIWLTVNSGAEGEQGYLDAAATNALIAAQASAETARIIDSEGTIGRLYNAKTTPHMYVIDTAGTLVYMGAIDDRPTADHAALEGATNYVTLALEALKNGTPVETTVTQAYGCNVKYKS